MNEGTRWKKRLWSEQGRTQLEEIPLALWASRRRQDLLGLLDRMNPTIAELTAAVEQEAKKRPEVLRLMTHPGVGPLTALAFVIIIMTPDRFPCGKQIGSYIGLIPCEDSSAGLQRLGHISKQGNTPLRFLLGVAWPYYLTVEFTNVWAQVVSELEAKGIRAGPKSLRSWNDSDAGLARAIWCLTNHLKPKVVVETRVAHGVTSRFILEALAKRGDGHLWSIDLPPMEYHWQEQIGMAVDTHHADRWPYIKGPRRLRPLKLLSQVGGIGLFIHDSLHSARNVRFELDRAWAALMPGGALVVDDIDANWDFCSFLEAFPDQQSVICEAEPLRVDDRRFNMKGLFGIILKEATATPAVRGKAAGAS
jgi:hypothetical protein